MLEILSIHIVDKNSRGSCCSVFFYWRLRFREIIYIWEKRTLTGPPLHKLGIFMPPSRQPMKNDISELWSITLTRMQSIDDIWNVTALSRCWIKFFTTKAKCKKFCQKITEKIKILRRADMFFFFKYQLNYSSNLSLISSRNRKWYFPIAISLKAQWARLRQRDSYFNILRTH